MGSPVASFVSGPGVALTKAICFEAGDQAVVAPTICSGELVPSISARKRGDEPSAAHTYSPAFPAPAMPWKAIARPSGDHTGLPPRASAPPTGAEFRVASV